MEIGQLYNFVLVLVLVFILVGVGVLALDKFQAGQPEVVNVTLGNASSAIGSVATTWGTLIVTIGILAIVITLVVRGFGGGAGR